MADVFDENKLAVEDSLRKITEGLEDMPARKPIPDAKPVPQPEAPILDRIRGMQAMPEGETKESERAAIEQILAKNPDKSYTEIIPQADKSSVAIGKVATKK